MIVGPFTAPGATLVPGDPISTAPVGETIWPLTLTFDPDPGGIVTFDADTTVVFDADLGLTFD